jgi:hypothetical protein
MPAVAAFLAQYGPLILNGMATGATAYQWYKENNKTTADPAVIAYLESNPSAADINAAMGGQANSALAMAAAGNSPLAQALAGGGGNPDADDSLFERVGQALPLIGSFFNNDPVAAASAPGVQGSPGTKIEQQYRLYSELRADISFKSVSAIFALLHGGATSADIAMYERMHSGTMNG